MNDPMTGLGESLAVDYHEQMARWSALSTGFPEDALNASSGLAEDVGRLDEAWRSLTSLGAFLESGFVPEDLMGEVGGAPEPPEAAQQEGRAPGVRKGSFTPVFPAVSDNIRPANAPQEMRPPYWEEPFSSQLPGHTGPKPADHQPQNAAGVPQLELPQDLLKPGPPSDDPVTREIINHNRATSGSAWKGITTDTGDASTPAPTDSSVATDAEAFWRRPLQQLGDFATRMTFPDTDPDGPAAIAHPVLPGVTDDSPGNTESTEKGRNQSIDPASPIGPAAPDRSAPLNTGPESFQPARRMDLPLQPEQSEAFYFGASASLPESTPFPQALPPSSSVSDADDLLDALTERILRDFRRYYP